MQELIPFTAGLLLGAILALLRPGLRLAAGAAIAGVLGALATVISGEFRTSWSYLAFDIPLAAAAVYLGWLIARRIRRPLASDQG
jgi:hypothetical protein